MHVIFLLLWESDVCCSDKPVYLQQHYCVRSEEDTLSATPWCSGHYFYWSLGWIMVHSSLLIPPHGMENIQSAKRGSEAHVWIVFDVRIIFLMKWSIPSCLNINIPATGCLAWGRPMHQCRELLRIKISHKCFILMLMSSCVIMLRQSLCIFVFQRFSPSLSQGLNVKLAQRRHWPIVPVSISVRQSGCKFIKFFRRCSTTAWHALCVWIGAFVPDRELEIRLRHFCTCIPFTSHLISHHHTPSLSASQTHSWGFICNHWITAAPGKSNTCD